MKALKRIVLVLFVLSALHHVIEQLPAPRHINGGELAEGIRELALERQPDEQAHRAVPAAAADNGRHVGVPENLAQRFKSRGVRPGQVTSGFVPGECRLMQAHLEPPGLQGLHALEEKIGDDGSGGADDRDGVAGSKRGGMNHSAKSLAAAAYLEWGVYLMSSAMPVPN